MWLPLLKNGDTTLDVGGPGAVVSRNSGEELDGWEISLPQDLKQSQNLLAAKRDSNKREFEWRKAHVGFVEDRKDTKAEVEADSRKREATRAAKAAATSIRLAELAAKQAEDEDKVLQIEAETAAKQRDRADTATAIGVYAERKAREKQNLRELHSKHAETMLQNTLEKEAANLRLTAAKDKEAGIKAKIDALEQEEWVKRLENLQNTNCDMRLQARELPIKEEAYKLAEKIDALKRADEKRKHKLRLDALESQKAKQFAEEDEKDMTAAMEAETKHRESSRHQAKMTKAAERENHEKKCEYERQKASEDKAVQIECDQMADQAERETKRRVARAAVKSTERIARPARVNEENINANVSRNKVRDSTVKKIHEALHVESTSCCSCEKLAQWWLGAILCISRFTVLVVICGCELDLYGFALALCDYWIHGDGVMRAMLIIGPVGYIVALTLYRRLSKKQYPFKDAKEEDEEAQGEEDEEEDYTSHQPAGDSDNSDESDIEAGNNHIPFEEVQKRLKQLPKSQPREPVELTIFHYCPILRYFLLVKDFEANDVEALFRVNALSTFTLGFAQVVCMIIGLSAGILRIHSIFIKFGIVAQAVNIFNTIVYFGTSIPEMMKKSVQIDSWLYNTRKHLQEEYIKYNHAMRKYEQNKNPRNKMVIDLLRDRAIRDIKVKTNTHDMDLELLEMEDLFHIRQQIAKKQALVFARF